MELENKAVKTEPGLCLEVPGNGRIRRWVVTGNYCKI